MPSEEHNETAQEEMTTAEMPAVFSKLADIDVVCEGADASYAADIVVGCQSYLASLYTLPTAPMPSLPRCT